MLVAAGANVDVFPDELAAQFFGLFRPRAMEERASPGSSSDQRPRINSASVTSKHSASFSSVESRTSSTPRSIFW
jgi:hypothetical protein